MKLKDYLKNLPSDINISGLKILSGNQLRILEPHFSIIDELKDIKIEIIESFENVGDPVIEMTDDGISIKQETNPSFITLELKKFDLRDFNNIIKLYSLFLQNDEVFIRCSYDSIFQTI